MPTVPFDLLSLCWDTVAAALSTVGPSCVSF